MFQTSRSTFASVRLLASMSLFLALHSTATAQVTAVAQVSGSITDPSGAGIANAQVSMTEVNKQMVHSTVSDATGNYTLSNLPVGP